MMDLRLGFKIYDNDWALRHNLTPEEAADFLAALSATFVIVQSRYLPMHNSAVRSDSTGHTVDDLAFRRALAERNISYFACLNICFDPAFTAAHPDLLPLDQHGQRETPLDWYIGLPPDRAENLAHKQALLANAIPLLEPDGIHLGFVRWPGFWETWLPDTHRAQMPDYCYSPRTLTRFCEDTRADLPTHHPMRAAQIIAQRYRAAWRDWKCGVTLEAIAQLRSTLDRVRPGAPVAINTLPFFREQWDNAVEEVFGQDIARLSTIVDIFEVMSYHQILRRDAAWPAAIGADIRHRARAAQPAARVICTLQAKALYLDGMHAGRDRATCISAEEFAHAVSALETSPVDGLCIFTFTQLLDARDTPDGRNMLARLRAFRTPRALPLK